MKAQKIIHHKEARIKVEFAYDSQVIEQVKRIDGARWSQTHRAWHVPYTQEAYGKLKEVFPDLHTQEPAPSVSESSSSRPTSTIPTDNEIKAQYYGKRILLFMRPNEEVIRFLQTLKGIFFDKERKCWSLPNDPDILLTLRQRLGDSLVFQNQPSPSSLASKHHALRDKGVLRIVNAADAQLHLFLAYQKEHIKFLRQLPYSQWNRGGGYWDCPDTENHRKDIKQHFESAGFRIEYSEEKPNVKQRPSFVPKFKKAPPEYLEKLSVKRYSPNTARAYIAAFESFINYYEHEEPIDISENQIKAYLLYLVEKRQVSESYQNVMINAVKFYYEQVLGGQRKFYQIDRPFKPQKLPSVLSTEEVQRIIGSVDNLKHKCILLTIYSAGLRISELIQLKVADIDSKRMQIHIKGAKGKKDRYTILSEKLLICLRDYFKEYRPKEYLFEGQTGTEYSARSAQQMFQKACRKSKILKTVSLHSLRHSFATHLLENGTGLRYIQTLLGHGSSKTTEIYTHITNKGMEKIKSPLDKLDL